MWARITFPRFKKDDVTVVDITWEITIISLESTDEPYVDIDKSGLWSSFTNAFGILVNKYGSDLNNLMSLLEEGIKVYASQYVDQQTVSDIAQRISLEADRIKDL